MSKRALAAVVAASLLGGACTASVNAPLDAGVPSSPATDAGHARGDGGVTDDDSGPAPCPAARAATLTGNEGERVALTLPAGCDAVVTMTLARDALVEIGAPGAALSLEGAVEQEPGWLATRALDAGEHALAVAAPVDDDVTVTLSSHGPPVGQVLIERSLVWRAPAVVEDTERVGLGRLLAVVSEDGHGGLLLERWLTRFSTTAHSERAGPALLAEELKEELGPDASAWDTSALPFVVTAVHNRLDLRDGERCGELRVSLASLHEVWRPLHLIFLFAQPALAGDVSPGGVVHCHATARRWARLSALDDEHFLAAARAILDEGLVKDRFLLAESEELTVSPWEWRQWTLVENPDESEREALPFVFENVPLFQTVDIAAVNAPGPLREAFLAFVNANAAALDERRQLIPPSFRPPSVRVNSGVPWQPLDLSGVDEDVLASYPRLRQHIETVGCAGCHSAGEFVQTREDRSFSTFYDGELAARRDHLSSLQAGALEPRPPFGALQADPPLTP